MTKTFCQGSICADRPLNILQGFALPGHKKPTRLVDCDEHLQV
ncbi:hypothetical protein OOU_Y34scaffold00493g2 [Pyricularia oryzae Y34]|uniref:Uncharacterized protein n=3 Tax=Pyricularia oryzae TaxID=318829 RepID=A0A4P7N4B7_PYROR|nr:hypothetical protein OOU_Y34scaffold00493g2 [Pyricularia oryzae Y34]QBZ57337.1 hypothetical protein PoMZ_02261 [Pyricularia oryzae]